LVDYCSDGFVNNYTGYLLWSVYVFYAVEVSVMLVNKLSFTAPNGQAAVCLAGLERIHDCR